MSPDAASLPDDIALLKAMLIAVGAELEQLRMQVARLRRMAFGRSSEKLTHQADQLELGLEEREAEAATAAMPVATRRRETAKPYRQPLPDHLPRTEVVHDAPCVCPDCGGAMRRMGEDVTEQLDYVPASFRVVRHVRPRLSCRSCERIVQAPLPSMPIERGRPGAGLLAHVLVSKYADHLPLYRQSGIYARQGVDLARSTLADWVGRSAALLDPLVDALERHVMGGVTLHADDTPVPVLAPGAGRTRTGRLWTYVRDERGAGGEAPPAVLFRYAPDRKGERPVAHLRTFQGDLHADGYAGFDRLYGERIAEVACWAHVRRKFFDVHAATGSATAREALDHIASLYAVEQDVRGRPRTSDDTYARPELDRCSMRSVSGSTRPDRSCPDAPTSRSPSAMRSPAGRRLPAMRTMAALRSTTMPPSARCAVLPSVARTGCSPAPTRAATAPPASTALWKPPGSTTSTPRHG
ncbi:hypothetical protein GCM10020258_55650 [Sphingomonas yabuuchiae]